MPMRDLRRNYELKALNREDLFPDPIEQFHHWFADAQAAERPNWLELNAMTLATYDIDAQQVSARMVLLKHVDAHGFTFFSNYDSDKGRQLASHPSASLVLYWPHIERQVRVQGTVTKTDIETSARYFHARPRSSQLGAAASMQSAPVADRHVLEAEVARLDKLYQGREIPRPEHWGGYVVSPCSIEFWQGRRDRLHDRFLYRRESAALEDRSWAIERLSP
jgi:pyridoxamine 5'-phosphate oxidase